MSTTYDLIVVGSGVAAFGVATRVRRAGWRVAIVDYRPVGGTCALRGCDPKKVLVGIAAALDRAGRLHGRGLTGDMRLDWLALIRFERSFTDPVPEQREQSLARAGIDAFHGLARFAGRDSIVVQSGAHSGAVRGEHGSVGGHDEVLRARRFVIASGAEPVKLHIPGEEYLTTSEQFMALEALPDRIVFVGGGYIASEFSGIAARAGARVTLLQRGERILPQFDPDLVAWLAQSFRSAGIEVRTGAAVEAIERNADGKSFRVRVSSPQGQMTVGADLVVHAAGRAPALTDLALSQGGIGAKEGRLELNEFLQSTSNPVVYAAGDSAHCGPPLTPAADSDAQVVASNLLEGNHVKASYAGMPTVAFTIPPIASVGMSEAAARAEGHRFRSNCRRVPSWYTARRLNEPLYGFKTLVEEGTGRILGAHLVGPGADETINLFALAIRHGLAAEKLKEAHFAYPTAASDVTHML